MNEFNYGHFANAQAQAPVDANALMQAQVNYGNLLSNAAVQTDGIELDFQGDRCGSSYRIRQNSIKVWDSFFYDWREGWVEIRNHGGWHKRREAIETCNKHAVENRLIKFVPHRTKFKLNPAGWAGIAAAASGAASAGVLGFGL
jgi:hypothetical protein